MPRSTPKGGGRLRSTGARATATRLSVIRGSTIRGSTIRGSVTPGRLTPGTTMQRTMPERPTRITTLGGTLFRRVAARGRLIVNRASAKTRRTAKTAGTARLRQFTQGAERAATVRFAGGTAAAYRTAPSTTTNVLPCPAKAQARAQPSTFAATCRSTAVPSVTVGPVTPTAYACRRGSPGQRASASPRSRWPRRTRRRRCRNLERSPGCRR